jgi:hypothetical protein
MSSNGDEIVSILESHKALITDENVDAFMAALEQLKMVKADVNLLNRLMALFADNTEDIFPFDGLVQYIRSQDHNLVIESVMNNTPQMIEKARGWLVILYVVIITRHENQNMLVLNYKKLPNNTKKVVREFLESVALDIAGFPPETELDMGDLEDAQKAVSFIFENSDTEDL